MELYPPSPEEIKFNSPLVPEDDVVGGLDDVDEDDEDVSGVPKPPD
tara:strand:+ start:394 stop:531 length:138 start_codon:yes stop_codon:yes gene_type:complete